MEAEMSSSAKLMQELWMMIFSKLPAKTLLQLRAVSRTWRSIIDNPSFISMHIAHFKNKSDKHFLISFETERILHALNDYTLHIRVRTMDIFKIHEEIYATHYSSENYLFDCKGYVDGLVLLVRYLPGHYDLFLFNPSIWKSIVLPELPPYPMGRNEALIGFDPAINDYKVVWIVFPFRLPGETTPAAIMVYQLGTGVWRVNSDIEAPEEWHLGEKVLTNGVLHWISYNHEVHPLSRNLTHIISFNFSSETFSFTELPGDRSDKTEKITRPFLLGDSLAVMDVFRDAKYASRANLYIWKMNMNKGARNQSGESWSEWYHRSIGLDVFRGLKVYKDNIRNLIFDESLHKFWLVVNGRLKSFDLRNGTNIDIVPSHLRYSMYPYVESLLLCRGRYNHVSSATQTEEVG